MENRRLAISEKNFVAQMGGISARIVADSPPQPTTVRRGESSMSKPSRRPTREARKQHKLKRRAAQRQLCARRAEVGWLPPRAASVSNRLCPYSSEAEEQAA